ncbi:MAG: GGDEF domain-containing protein [Steroidobacteraceae bacterium]
MMVDLDRLKPINDQHGHEAGDRVLVQVAEILRQVSRSSDHVVRWGGDEFLLLCRDADMAVATELAERVRASIAKQIFRVGEGVAARTSCSIGYSVYPFVSHHPEYGTWGSRSRSPMPPSTRPSACATPGWAGAEPRACCSCPRCRKRSTAIRSHWRRAATSTSPGHPWSTTTPSTACARCRARANDEDVPQLDDSLIAAMPDFVAFLRRDGTVLRHLGGRHLGLAGDDAPLAGRRLEELWDESVAQQLRHAVGAR